MPKLAINKLNIAQIFLLLFFAALLLPIHYLFPTQSSYATGVYSDFTSITLYLSDILLIIATLFTFLPRGEEFKSIVKGQLLIVVLIIWLILNLFYHKNTNSGLNYWVFAKFIELIVAYETFYYLFRKTDLKGLILRFFVFLSSFESILALYQFIAQHSFGHGLNKLGEQVIGPNIDGVAKIVSSGTILIRAYGTFPHPNVLSAFLVTGILLSLYFLLNSYQFKSKVIFATAIFINCVGLSLTFSRAAILALAVGLFVFFVVLAWSKRGEAKKHILGSFVVVILSIGLSAGILMPYLVSRATITDDASVDRILFAGIGINMIKLNPLFGVGIGESVLHMQQYSAAKLFWWQIQPIHNYFLLAAAELGIVGALILICILFLHLKSLISNLKSQKQNLFSICLIAILISFLVLMQFDHYFYTLQQTQMLLWVILGVSAAEIKNPQVGD